MNFLEYSNKTQSNIIPKEEFSGLIREVFDVISTNISKSLGPLGSSATILDGMITEATKDGFSILKNYRFHNRYKKMIYNLIMTPCTLMNNTVGDGTTTAIALTNALFKRYDNRKDVLSTVYRLPRQFTHAWDEVIDELKLHVQSKTTPIDPEDYDTIYNLAYVTSNGNAEISKAIADTYKDAKSPAIKQKDSPTNKSYISAIDGFDFPANLLNDAYVRNDDLSVQEQNICVMIFDHKLETDVFQKLIVPINDVLRAQGKKLLVLASLYDAYMCDTVLEQYVNMEYRQYGSLNLILAQFNLGKLEDQQMSDLAIILRTKVINQDIETNMLAEISEGRNIDEFVENIFDDPNYKFSKMIGTAAKALLTCKNGSIFNVNNIEEDERYQDTLRRAKKDLEDLKATTNHERQAYASKIYAAKGRVLQLEMKNYIYYIGADSKLQKDIIWASVEDVIKCVRSAIKYGVVPGCQITIARACLDFIKDINDDGITDPDNIPDEVYLKTAIANIVYSAVIDVYTQILHGPEYTGMIKLLPRWYATTEDGQEALQQEAIKKANDIIDKSIDNNRVFDMETLDYNEKIITSTETDVLVLTAASELVKVLISGNQCIFLDSDVNESHNEGVDVYA